MPETEPRPVTQACTCSREGARSEPDARALSAGVTAHSLYSGLHENPLETDGQSLLNNSVQAVLS